METYSIPMIEAALRRVKEQTLSLIQVTDDHKDEVLA